MDFGQRGDELRFATALLFVVAGLATLLLPPVRAWLSPGHDVPWVWLTLGAAGALWYGIAAIRRRRLRRRQPPEA